MSPCYASIIEDVVTEDIGDIDLIVEAIITAPGWKLCPKIYLPWTHWTTKEEIRELTPSLRDGHDVHQKRLLSIVRNATAENKLQFSMAAIHARGITSMPFIKRGIDKSGGEIYLYANTATEIERPILVKTEEGDTIDDQRARYRLAARFSTIENYRNAFVSCERDYHAVFG
jgi:hypothetical protein